MPQRISLHCLAGPLQGRIFRLEGGPAFVFGRYSKLDCCLAADPASSLLHFLVDVSDDRIRILDLGSTNGLVVNNIHFGGKRGAPMREFLLLRAGDAFVAGSCLFRLDVVPEAALDDAFFFANPGAEPLRADFRGNSAEDTVSNDDSPLLGFPFVEGYTLLGEIGDGGGGAVYRAVKEDTGADAAIKLMIPGRSGTRRPLAMLHREIRMTKQFDHPNIVRRLGDGIADGAPYLALEYADGGSLDELIRRAPEGTMEFSRAAPLFIQLLEAVAHMHSRHFVHRAVRPKNILLALRGGGMYAVKLSGLGLSCRFGGMETAEFPPIGEDGDVPGCMPPEQLADLSRVAPQSDVFSCAMTLRRMLGGGALRPDVPRPVGDVIGKALSLPPEDRYEHAAAMLLAFKSALA